MAITESFTNWKWNKILWWDDSWYFILANLWVLKSRRIKTTKNTPFQFNPLEAHQKPTSAPKKPADIFLFSRRTGISQQTGKLPENPGRLVGLFIYCFRVAMLRLSCVGVMSERLSRVLRRPLLLQLIVVKRHPVLIQSISRRAHT